MLCDVCANRPNLLGNETKCLQYRKVGRIYRMAENALQVKLVLLRRQSYGILLIRFILRTPKTV